MQDKTYMAITKGIRVSVEVTYQENYSKPRQNEYVFSYHVRIANEGESAVKLLRRQWNIFDSDGRNIVVNGDGVVGKQPIIAPGQSYEYVSGCQLNSELGRMKGIYVMEKIHNGLLLEIRIPAFELMVPYRMN